MTLHARTLFTTAPCSVVYSLFSPPSPPAVPFALAFKLLLLLLAGCGCRCLVPDADGWASADVVDVDGSPEKEAVEEEALAEVFIDASNFKASGVSKREMDFWQNLRAEGTLPASRCFWAIERHRRASSLLLSIVEGGRNTANLKCGRGGGGSLGLGFFSKFSDIFYLPSLIS